MSEMATKNNIRPAVPSEPTGSTNNIGRPKTHMKYAEVKNDYLTEIEHIEKLTKTTCITYKSNSNHHERWLAAESHENADAEFAFSLQTLEKYQMSKDRIKECRRSEKTWSQDHPDVFHLCLRQA